MSDTGDEIRGLFARLTGEFEDMAGAAAEGQGHHSPEAWQQIANRLIDGLRQASDTAASIFALTVTRR